MEVMKESAPELLHDRNWQISMSEMEKFDKLPRVKIARDWIITNKPQSLLDIGCGPGYLARIIKNDYPQIEIHGIDFSKTAIDHASKFLERSWRLDLDYENIPAGDGTYDAIICMEILEHVYNVAHVLHEIKRLLKPQGKALISVPNLAYWRFRFQLLIGIFPHPEVFCSEHIHAFVLSSLQEKLAEAGLYISVNIGVTEPALNSLPKKFLNFLAVRFLWNVIREIKPVQYLFMPMNIATYKHVISKLTHFYWISGGSAFGNLMF